MSKVEGTGGSREINRNLQLRKGEQKSSKALFNYGGENTPSNTHTVSKGENAFKITRKYNITIYQLAEANGWKVVRDKKGNITLKQNGKPVNLQAGMKITIPDKNPPAEKSTQKQPAGEPAGIYTVKPSDSPMKIANNNGISIRQLAHANGWEISSHNDKITVLKNGKNVVLQKGEKLNLPQSVTDAAAGVQTLSDAKIAAGMSDSFADVIVGFEGDPDNDYKPYTEPYPDDNGVLTIGYGYTKGVNSQSRMKPEEAHAQLAKDYLQAKEDLRIELGDEIFEQIPQPMKEGLIDLIFNKGFEAFDKETFSAAIQSGDIATAFEQLIFTRSIKTGEEMNGLYKRSLARLAMVYKGFDSDTQAELKPVIDSFYEKCKTRVKINELNKWWNGGQNKDSVQTQPQYIVQEGDTGLMSIAKKLGINYKELVVLNKHLDKDLTIHPGDAINLPVKGVTAASAPLDNKPLADEIIRIKELDLSDKERLQKTEEVFDKYVKYYGIPQEASDIFKKDAKDEYNAWFRTDTDNMRAMAGVLDAQNPEDLHKAIQNAIDESSEARKFTGLVLNKKITEDNIRGLIENAGGAEKFVKMIKKAGGFEVLRHSLNKLVNKDENNTEIFKRFEQAVKNEKYSDIIKVFNNVLAASPEEISQELAKTLDKDDDLNSMLYKYQIQRVNKGNVLEVLRANDIISGICEAENDRSTCKAEIMKLYNLLDKNYALDDNKKKEFLELVNREFRTRKIWNPTTWWIGTSKISEAFKNLIKGDIKGKNARTEVCRVLGFSEDIQQLEKLTDENGKVIPLVETYEPNGDGPLNGRRIVVNSGHGGYGEGDDSVFDPGALNKEVGVNEWMLNRYMAKQLIEALQAQGAEVILTAGEVNTVSFNDFGGELKISLHADSHDGTSGPRLYAFDKDKADKILADKILSNFINNEHVSNLKDLKRKEITYHLDMQTNDEDVDSMQAKIVDTSHLQILKKDRKRAADEPAVLVEYCNITKNNEVNNIVFGNTGKEIINSIVAGVIDYYGDDRLANL